MRRPPCDAVAGGAPGCCSRDRVEVWHGLVTPAHVCGKHAQGEVKAAFEGHRKRLPGWSKHFADYGGFDPRFPGLSLARRRALGEGWRRFIIGEGEKPE